MYNQNKKIKMHVHVKIMLFVFMFLFTKSVYLQESENITQIGLWENNSCLAVAVTDTLAYVAAGLEGMHIINISNPSAPEKISTIKSSKEGKATCVEVNGSYAYLLYDKIPLSYMQIINITDPTSPKEVSTFEIEKNIYDIVVDGSYAYIAAGNEGLQIVDISNIETPIKIGIFNTEYSASSVEIKGSYLYLADAGWSWGKVRTLDVTNPPTPEEINFVETPYDGGPYALTISDSSAYIIWISDSGSSHLHVLDISNPYASIDKNYSSTFSAAWSIAVEGSYIFLAIDSYGLQMLDITNLTYYSWENLSGYFKTSDMPLDVTVNGSYIYLVDDDDGLYILQNDLLIGVNETNNDILKNFSLEQNYPNPFNPTTTISYQIPAKSMVVLKVFNMLGQEVTTLVNEMKSTGKYTVTFSADGLPSGMYIYHMQSGNFNESKKTVILK